MTIKIKKTDGSWSVVSGGGGPAGTVGFSDLTGLPGDNAQLAAALDSKVTRHEGTFEIGKNTADGPYVWEEE